MQFFNSDNWILFTVLCTLCWGAADLFYKLGADEKDRYSHLKTSCCVGLVMGAHAIVTLLCSDIGFNPLNLLIYLPVSCMYILSMTVGYLGLRYLELSVSSPVQNTSGAVVCILCMVFMKQIPDPLSGIAAMVICIGVFVLGLLEFRESRSELSADADRKYVTGFKAFMLPIAYCIIDALGTFFDAWYLDDIDSTPLVDVSEDTIETVANTSYELTFLICALLLFIYIRFIKKEHFIPHGSGKLYGARLGAAAFETAGQFAYIYAMSGNAVIAAPVVASYCTVSLILSRIILKEKLSLPKYAAVGLAMAGIILLGIVEGLAE